MELAALTFFLWIWVSGAMSYPNIKIGFWTRFMWPARFAELMFFKCSESLLKEASK